MGVPEDLQRGPKRPKTAFLGPHIPRRPFLTCETVSLHRPGCALTCSTLVSLCSTSLEPPDPLMLPKRLFLAILDALGALWHTHMALPDPQNCSNASPWMCPDFFHPYSKLFRQFGATRSAYGWKRPFLAVLGALWHTQMALPGPQNYSNSLLGMCPDLFHPCFTLFH